MTMVLVQLFLAAAMFKWRKLVHIALIYELVFQFLISFIPSTQNNYTLMYIVMAHFCMFLAWYSNRGWQLIVATFFAFLSFLVIQHIVFLKELNGYNLLMILLMTLLVFVCAGSFAIMARLIEELNFKFKSAN